MSIPGTKIGEARCSAGSQHIANHLVERRRAAGGRSSELVERRGIAS